MKWRERGGGRIRWCCTVTAGRQIGLGCCAGTAGYDHQCPPTVANGRRSRVCIARPKRRWSRGSEGGRARVARPSSPLCWPAGCSAGALHKTPSQRPPPRMLAHDNRLRGCPSASLRRLQRRARRPTPPPPLFSVRFPSGSMAPTRGRFRHGQLASPTLPIFVLVLTLMVAAAAAVSVAATEAPEERLGTAVVRVSGPATKRVTRPLDLSTGAPLYVCSG